MSSVTHISETSFATDLTAAPIVVVNFWGTWCGPCIAFAPVFEASAVLHPDINHHKVDIDENSGLAATYEIRSVPTTMFVRDGIVISRITGALTPARLEDLITQTRNLDMEMVRKQTQR